MSETELKNHFKVEYYKGSILLYEKEPSEESFYKYKYLAQIVSSRKGWYKIVELPFEQTNNINVLLDDIKRLNLSREFISDAYIPSLPKHTKFIIPIWDFLFKNGFVQDKKDNVFINYNLNIYQQSNPIIIRLDNVDVFDGNDPVKVGIINNTTQEYIYSTVNKDTKVIIETIKEYLLSLYMVESASNYINSYKLLKLSNINSNLNLDFNTKSSFNFDMKEKLIEDLQSIISNLKSI